MRRRQTSVAGLSPTTCTHDMRSMVRRLRKIWYTQPVFMHMLNVSGVHLHMHVVEYEINLCTYSMQQIYHAFDL